MNGLSPHLEISIAADLARNLIHEEDSWAIEHVERCWECSRLVDLFRRMHAVAQSMEETPVPETWTKVADDVFVRGMLGSALWLPPRTAEIIYSSFSEPRGTGLVTYESDDCSVDLYVNIHAGSDDVVIAGQILIRHPAADALSGTPIVLLHQARVLAHTTATALGEFQLTFDRQNDLRLAFAARSQQIELPLDAMFE